MLKSLILLTAAIAITLTNRVKADDDDLFSEISSVSVFSSTSDSGSSPSKKTAVPKRIKTSEQLRDLIKGVGFEAKAASTRAVSTEKALEPWTFPVLLIMSEDETTINIVLGLTAIKDVEKELPAATLLKMMTASQDNAPTLFAYRAARERTEVSIVVKNSNLSGQMLRDEINRLAVLAKKTSDVWASASQKAAAEGTTPETKVETPVTVTNSLTGKWAASKSDKEAFAVEFKADETFALVYINNGNQTKSSGKFTIENGSLTLSGSDGMKLQGKLTVTSDSEFTFKPANSTTLTFKKA